MTTIRTYTVEGTDVESTQFDRFDSPEYDVWVTENCPETDDDPFDYCHEDDYEDDGEWTEIVVARNGIATTIHHNSDGTSTFIRTENVHQLTLW